MKLRRVIAQHGGIFRSDLGLPRLHVQVVESLVGGFEGQAQTLFALEQPRLGPLALQAPARTSPTIRKSAMMSGAGLLPAHGIQTQKPDDDLSELDRGPAAGIGCLPNQAPASP